MTWITVSAPPLRYSSGMAVSDKRLKIEKICKAKGWLLLTKSEDWLMQAMCDDDPSIAQNLPKNGWLFWTDEARSAIKVKNLDEAEQVAASLPVTKKKARLKLKSEVKKRIAKIKKMCTSAGGWHITAKLDPPTPGFNTIFKGHVGRFLCTDLDDAELVAKCLTVVTDLDAVIEYLDYEHEIEFQDVVEYEDD